MKQSRHTSGRVGEGTRGERSESGEGKRLTPSPGGFALSRAQRRLLEACLTHHTIDSDTLGGLLCLSPETVRTHFKALCRGTGRHERFAVLMFALESGLITLPWAI